MAHFKACLDDCEWQHADASDSSGTCSEQNSLTSVGCPVQEVVLLQGVEGAEVDAHPRDAAHKRLPERERETEVLKISHNSAFCLM